MWGVYPIQNRREGCFQLESPAVEIDVTMGSINIKDRATYVTEQKMWGLSHSEQEGGVLSAGQSSCGN